MAIKWNIDPTHSEIQFRVKHLMISTVTGYFKHFDGYIETESEDFKTTTKIVFSAETESIDTNNEQRDTHLKSADFFQAEEHPKIKFVGDRYAADGETATLHGDLTIRNVTKPITLEVEFGGIVDDPYGQRKAGFTVTGKIKRKEFGLVWDAVTEAGKIVVGDEIRIHCEVQFIKQE